MSITLTIAGTDRSTAIEWESLEVEQQLTSQVDTCKFRLKKHTAKPFAPSIGDAVTVATDDPLYDDFNNASSINIDKWNDFNDSQISVAAGLLKIASIAGGSYAGVYSLVNFNLTSAYIQTKMTNAGDQTIASWEVYPVLLQVGSDGDNRVYYYLSNNTLKAYKKVAGVTTQVGSNAAYNSSTMIYFRIREASGTLYWEYSADAVTWTTQTSLANPFAITGMRYYIQVGTWQVEATTTYALFDDATVSSRTSNIFGGTIARIDDSIEAGLLTRLEVSCVGHERTLDRFLAVREFTSVSARYILAGLLDEFANQPGKEIDLGESTETWTTEDGTVAANTTAGQFIQGSQSRKFTATAGATATARRETTLNLTTFGDGSAAGTDAMIQVWYYVDTPANFASLDIISGSDAGATLTNYYQYTITNTPRTGWNQAVIAKSAFTAVGAPNWNDSKKRRYRVTASAAGTVRVSVDDVRLLPAAPFTMHNVRDADTPTLGSAKFNYEQVSDAVKQIAEAVGTDWYVDSDKDLHFFAPSTEMAPYSLTDTSLNFLWNSLSLSSDISTIKNRIIVRGGEYQGTATDFDVEADGISLNYRSPYRIKNISVTVNAVSKTVGVDNLNDPASYDCLYNYQEKTLKFKTATKPTAGQTVRMTGNPMIPVIIKRDDPTSIASFGVFEFLIIDKSIGTQQGARDRALAELKAYRDQLTEGEFVTDTVGLRSGQTININLTARSIADSYIIKSVLFTMASPTEMQFKIGIVSTRTFGIIEYLIGQLRASKKQISITDDEVVDYVADIDETLTIMDTIAANAHLTTESETIDGSDALQSQLDHGTIFVFAPYTPANFADTKRPFILNGSPLA